MESGFESLGLDQSEAMVEKDVHAASEAILPGITKKCPICHPKSRPQVLLEAQKELARLRQLEEIEANQGISNYITAYSSRIGRIRSRKG